MDHPLKSGDLLQLEMGLQAEHDQTQFFENSVTEEIGTSGCEASSDRYGDFCEKETDDSVFLVL